jgi:hypothetical protein
MGIRNKEYVEEHENRLGAGLLKKEVLLGRIHHMEHVSNFLAAVPAIGRFKGKYIVKYAGGRAENRQGTSE